MTNKNVVILGSTGSVGVQTLEVCENLGINAVALTANKNIGLLEQQIRKYHPEVVAVFDEKYAKLLKKNVIDTNTKVLCGMEGLCEVACMTCADIMLTAVSGMVGLLPTLEAIKSKKNIALANKETLVAGGELVMRAARDNHVSILPVDSEHSAIFQCLNGSSKYLNKLILTASGGPLFGIKKSDLKTVTVKEALDHPNWKMGTKISIDSATMMNKGLEIIEACHLFNLPESKVDAIIHRESIIHSMVEYVDGSVIAQMGVPTMKTPIQYALTYPSREKLPGNHLNLTDIKNLSFFEIDSDTFEAVNICRGAICTGGSAPLVINSANEVAVDLFLNNKIKFSEIIELIKTASNKFKPQNIESFEQILEIDALVRDFLYELF